MEGPMEGRSSCTTHPERKIGPAAATSDTCLLPQMKQKGKNSASIFFNLKFEVFSNPSEILMFLLCSVHMLVITVKITSARTYNSNSEWRSCLVGSIRGICCVFIRLFTPAGHSHQTVFQSKTRCFNANPAAEITPSLFLLVRLKEVRALI